MYIAGSRFMELLDVLRREAAANSPVYLVGGAVRDILRNQPVHDLDLVLTERVRPLARRVANRLGGDFYMLDEERDTARVIDHSPEGGAIFLDFCSLRAPNLESDLRDRDFTVNAIAIDLRHSDRLIDPTGGAQDLRAGLLRACSPQSLERDPVRVLRGVRLSFSLNFTIQPETQAWMRQAAPLLARISAERQRDELFRMLEGGQVSSAIQLLDTLGALDLLLPELAALKGVTQSPPHILDVWEHTLALLRALDRLWAVLVGEPSAGSLPEEKPLVAAAVSRLGRYQTALADHFSAALNPNRSLRSLLFLAALYHDIAKPSTRTVEPGGRIRFLRHEDLGATMSVERAHALALSQVEIQRLESIVSQHMRIHLLANTGERPSSRAIYRFFRDAGPAGIDIILLSLADVLATYGDSLPLPVWEAELEIAQALCEAWFERPADSVHPPRLVTGDDLMAALSLPPGPSVGRLLADIQEAQAAGEITTREQAIAFAKSQCPDLPRRSRDG
jgi:tRNA nucleotidyltransferase/poly(A) polymerase